MKVKNEAGYSSYRWLIQGVWVLILLIQYYLPFAVAPLLTDIMSEYDLDYATGGLLITVVAVIGGVSMFGGGGVIRRMGLKRGAGLALVLFLAGDLLTVTAPSYMILMAGRIFIGAGYGLVGSLTGAMTMSWFPPREQPFMNTFNTVCGTLGQTAAYSLTIPFLNVTGNWHAVFSAAGIAIAAVHVLWMIVGKNPQALKEGVKGEEETVERGREKAAAGREREEATAGREREKAAAGRERGLSAAWKKREIRNLAVACVGMFMTFTAVSAFLPTFLEQARGFSAEQASIITGSMPMAGLVGSLIVGNLSGIVGLRRPFMWPLMALALIGMLAASLSSDTAVITLGVCAVGFGISAYIPMIYTYLMDLPGANPEMVAAGVALTIGVSQIATLADSWIFNLMVPVAGLSGAFLIFGALLVLSLVFSLLLPETGPGRKKGDEKCNG